MLAKLCRQYNTMNEEKNLIEVRKKIEIESLTAFEWFPNNCLQVKSEQRIAEGHV